MKRQIIPEHKKKNSPQAPLQTHINTFSLATRFSAQRCSRFISDPVAHSLCVLSNKWQWLIFDVYSSVKKSTLGRGNLLAFIYAKEIYLKKTAWRGSTCVKTTHFKSFSTTSFHFLWSLSTRPSRFPSGLNQSKARPTVNLPFQIVVRVLIPTFSGDRLCFISATKPLVCYLALSTAFIVLRKVRAVSGSAFNTLVLFAVTFPAAEGPLHCSWSSFLRSVIVGI